MLAGNNSLPAMQTRACLPAASCPFGQHPTPLPVSSWTLLIPVGPFQHGISYVSLFYDLPAWDTPENLNYCC